jgi:Flagellar basal body-associated protein FliL.
MKKNILTIIIMAIVLINTVLTGLLIFTIVPTANKTNKLVSKVASIVDLELQSPNAEDNLTVEDIDPYNIVDKITVNLKSTDQTEHYMTMNASLSQNKKNKDYSKLKDLVLPNELKIKEIIQSEFSKYTKDEVQTNMEKIKADILAQIQEYFKSDFIVRVAFGNMLLE